MSSKKGEAGATGTNVGATSGTNANGKVPNKGSEAQEPDYDYKPSEKPKKTIDSGEASTTLIKKKWTGAAPETSSAKCKHKWDLENVRCPCSPGNSLKDRKGTTVEKWTLIQSALHRQITNVQQLKHIIMWYNEKFQHQWNFEALETYVAELSAADKKMLFNNTLPGMADLALKLPHIFPKPIPLLKKGVPHSITMSQYQIACLLANAFFCTFQHRDKRDSSYPSINFNSLFMWDRYDGVKLEKIKFILHYFQRFLEKKTFGTVSFKRKVLSKNPSWSDSKAELKTFNAMKRNTIESAGNTKLQVDFANKSIGGGVLTSGCAQEEILFLTCPEMIVSRLFTEELQPNETLLVTGCERYSEYEGYSYNLKFLGDHEDKRKRDKLGRLHSEIVCMDAFRYEQTPENQYREKDVLRELNKAYCGFAPVRDSVFDTYQEVATGNWGCGVFGGDPQLKALIQLMAASEAGRDISYYTFGDESLMTVLYAVKTYLKKRDVRVGELYATILRYRKEKGESVVDFIKRDVERERAKQRGKLSTADSRKAKTKNHKTEAGASKPTEQGTQQSTRV